MTWRDVTLSSKIPVTLVTLSRSRRLFQTQRPSLDSSFYKDRFPWTHLDQKNIIGVWNWLCKKRLNGGTPLTSFARHEYNPRQHSKHTKAQGKTEEYLIIIQLIDKCPIYSSRDSFTATQPWFLLRFTIVECQLVPWVWRPPPPVTYIPTPHHPKKWEDELKSHWPNTTCVHLKFCKATTVQYS